MSKSPAQRIKEIFEEAIELPTNQQDRFLEHRCGSDAALRAKIKELLRHDALTKGKFLEGTPIVDSDPTSHKEVVMRIIEGKLDDAALAPLGAHLARCSACASLVKHWRAKQDFDHPKPPAPRQASTETVPAVQKPGLELQPAKKMQLSETGPSSRTASGEQRPTIEGYRLTGVLGEGGMGKVYRAVELELDRVVALKVLSANAAALGSEALKRFRLEALATANLHHTHIIPIYHFGESHGTYYYTMELVEGQSLNKLISELVKNPTLLTSPALLQSFIRGEHQTFETMESPTSGASGTSSTARGKFYFQHVAQWMADAADALHHAHSKEIIHRDIKPSNLILSVDGRIMVTDFGIAKRESDRANTQVGSLVGTYRYMSPQQAMGSNRVHLDHRSDIYSLGVTMYELLCLKPAFPQEESQQILGAVTTADFTSPRKISNAVPLDLENICLKAMELRPANRYLTSLELADDLRRYLAGENIVAKRAGPLRRVAKFAIRRKAQVIAATAISLLLASGALLVLARQSIRERDIKNLQQVANFAAQEGKWDEAESAINKAIQLDPDRWQTYLFQVFTALSRFQLRPSAATAEALASAERACRFALVHVPNNRDALNYLGILLKKQDRVTEAIEVTRKLVKVDPTYFPALTNLGSYYALTSDWASAREHLIKAAEMADKTWKEGRSSDKKLADPWRSLASVALIEGDAKAVDFARRAWELRNDDLTSRLILARAYIEIDSLRDPEEAYAKARAADEHAVTGDPRAKRLLAIALLQKGEAAKALRAANEAIQLKDEPAFGYLLVALAQAKLGDITAARTALDAATQAWPEELTAHDFWATHDEGILWIESAAFWKALRTEAEEAITATSTGK